MVNRTLALIGVLLMLFAVGVGVYYFGLEYPRQAALGGPGGRAAQATITHVGTEESGRYQGYFAQMAYRDERGASHRLQAFYTFADWGTLQAGQTVAIRYLASNPDYAEDPRSYKARRDPRIMLALDVGILLLGIIVVVIAVVSPSWGARPR